MGNGWKNDHTIRGSRLAYTLAAMKNDESLIEN